MRDMGFFGLIVSCPRAGTGPALSLAVFRETHERLCVCRNQRRSDSEPQQSKGEQEGKSASCVPRELISEQSHCRCCRRWQRERHTLGRESGFLGHSSLAQSLTSWLSLAKSYHSSSLSFIVCESVGVFIHSLSVKQQKFISSESGG